MSGEYHAVSVAESILNGVVGLRDASPSRACDLVVDQLRDLILERALEPGSKLPGERDLAIRFQTSRATISQALRILSALGLVDIQHGSGVYVSPQPDRLLRHSIELLLGVDRPSMIKLVEARGWMEIAAARRAAELASDDDLRAIDHALRDLEGERESLERWLEFDIEFHRALLSASGNSFAVALLLPVLELIASARVDTYRSAGRPSWFTGRELEEIVALHERLAAAVGARDPDAAHAAAVEHHERLAQNVAEIDPWS